MRTAERWSVLGSCLFALSGCSDGAGGAAASTTASAASTGAAKTTASAASSAAPAASASAAPRSDCPKDSSGPGTITQPCAGKGATRLMDVKWTGKTDDEKGPYFAVKNVAPAAVLYGKVVVYFYDKDGKQLEVKDPAAAKPSPFVICAGSQLFSGIMKVDEKATLTFSCVKKDQIPEGTKAIEAEIVTVGFADAGGSKNEFYWTNKDLYPDARPKGGVK